jgi:hypothetical protein
MLCSCVMTDWELQCNLENPVPSNGRLLGLGVRLHPAKPTWFTRSPRYLDVRCFGRLAGQSRSACTRFDCVYSRCCRAASF